MSKAIQVKDISKAYQLGNFSTGTISRDIERFIAKIRGKEDPFLKIGETNDRTKTGKSDIVWSLKDINFEIEQGDAVGIVGKNGAGKSTLLKILSRITSPTTGNIKIKGRIASLLEVGTGFHPELTGRENIFLNGAILGMRTSEIKRKLDEIVDFSGIERYLDTPVKRYSSGMYVRLAFAVAAHLECEILVVDEVLAVGDAEFQKKCLGKMGEISAGEGKTILFVSHNMSSILSLTKNAVFLSNGKLISYDTTPKIVNEYLSFSQAKETIFISETKPDIPSIVKALYITKGNNSMHISGDDIIFKFFLNIPYLLQGMCLSFQIFDIKERAYTYNWIFDSEINFGREIGLHEITCEIPKLKLYKGSYNLSVHLAEQKGKTFFGSYTNICPFEVDINDNHEWGWPEDACAFLTDCSWDIKIR